MDTDGLSHLTAHEYLEQFQRNAFGNSILPYAADVGEVMTAALLGALSPEHQHALRDVAIGVIPSGNINAFTMKAPGGGDVICFNYGLLSYLLALNKLLMSRAGVFGLEPLLSAEDMVSEAKELAEAFMSNGVPKRRILAPRRMLISASLANAQAAFVVGHEVGHILLRHLHGVHEFESSHEMEFAADERGAEMVINGYLKNNDPLFGAPINAATLAAPDILLTYMALTVPSSRISRAHPSPLMRRERLRRRFWNDIPEQARILAGFAEKVFTFQV